MMECGVDEAGRGPMMGPLVVGAVWCSDPTVLLSIGVKDSKMLTPASRERMYAEISDAADAWCIVPMDAETIDRSMKTMSLNDIELGMFIEAVGKHDADVTYADCPDVNEGRFGAEMSAMLGGRKIVSEHKADANYPAVSAASIMAKVTRDRVIEDLKKEFGCNIGSGYPSDPATVSFVEKWIKDNGCPPPHTRRSWEPVKRMMSARCNSKITDW